MAQDLREADRAYLRGLLYTLGDGTPLAKETKVKEKESDWMVPVWLGASAIATIFIILLAVRYVYGFSLIDWLAWQRDHIAQQAGDSLQETVEQTRQEINRRMSDPGAGWQRTAPAEADAPALRGPKPGVEWDGKSIKAGKVVEESKAAPVDEPKYGKAIPTADPLVAQPVKPSKAQPTTEKVDRQGKETRP